ncbi:NDMA-dependent alcohol dehydrogenase [Phytohabitans sp. ZYX-F-186]|uniref:NDMA-dependent alcohol dehydrogenase n=1 Tax=Phytohabitans maris TaxID=3071409 RepID=A0ABU0ZA10_9ACTN|nr:NDMA-dependent alcohol dehydrogenase [Phytohabitans sp. ZYX-F-186]MDQ7903888.1 NDMA-dependent alcohol dehydrogenase [Phytohabitans sp. ZYX-F-186]
MKTRSATLWHVGQRWAVEELDLAEPGPGQVLVRIRATGLCHSDDHAVTGDSRPPLPLVGGHEGAGVVEAIGPGVTRASVGDHVVLAFNSPCGHCRYCAGGLSNLCAIARRRVGGEPAASPFSRAGETVWAMGGLGTFSERTVVPEDSVIVIDKDVPFAVAALLGCAVTTGWGAAVYLADVRRGETVVVVGCGGVGVNSLQGARNAGADIIVAVDPSEFKREQAVRFGATHAVADLARAREVLAELTGGHMADVAILSVGVADSDILGDMMSTLGLNGRGIITAVSPAAATTVNLSLVDFTLSQQTIRGNVYGGTNMHRDIPLLLGLYRRGKLQLDELISRTYPLDEINQGYADMHAGRNLRGVVLP